MSWVDGPLIGVDLETTSADPETAQIVNAAIVLDVPGEPVREWEWLAAVEIPKETEEFFDGRYTTERCLAEGIPERDVVEAMAEVFREHWTRECPLVAYNLCFDLTIFDRRNIALDCSWPKGGTDQVATGGPVTAPCLDPYVIDRKVGPRRKGKRKLGLVCAHYGVKLDEAEAHTAIADVRATIALMREIARRQPRMREQTLSRMFVLQQRWHREWAADFQEWLRGKKRQDGATDEEIAATVITGHWPIVPRDETPIEMPLPRDEAPAGAYAQVAGRSTD